MKLPQMPHGSYGPATHSWPINNVDVYIPPPPPPPPPRYSNHRNFRRGLIFVNFGPTKNSEIILHMYVHCMTGQNDEVKSCWKLKILEKSGNVQN